MLEKLNMRAEWTTSGKGALECAKNAVEAGDMFGVYIISWQLSDINGIEAVKQIATNFNFRMYLPIGSNCYTETVKSNRWILDHIPDKYKSKLLKELGVIEENLQLV